MVALRWIGRYWYIPILAFVGIVGFVIGSKRNSVDAVGLELRAIDAGERARIDEIDRGTAAANAKADQDYSEQISKLDLRQGEKVNRLRRNPARRVRFLERLSGEGD